MRHDEGDHGVIGEDLDLAKSHEAPLNSNMKREYSIRFSSQKLLVALVSGTLGIHLKLRALD